MLNFPNSETISVLYTGNTFKVYIFKYYYKIKTIKTKTYLYLFVFVVFSPFIYIDMDYKLFNLVGNRLLLIFNLPQNVIISLSFL